MRDELGILASFEDRVSPAFGRRHHALSSVISTIFFTATGFTSITIDCLP
jgi:coproporphyrinogen III oxidase-like Fe-S oxidoreductase